MKSKKWPLAHVWSHIITLKHPKLIPFVSARMYDHEEVLEHTSLVPATPTNNLLEALKVKGDHHSSTILELAIGKIHKS